MYVCMYEYMYTYDNVFLNALRFSRLNKNVVGRYLHKELLYIFANQNNMHIPVKIELRTENCELRLVYPIFLIHIQYKHK